jgi:hypothetical protein
VGFRHGRVCRGAAAAALTTLHELCHGGDGCREDLPRDILASSPRSLNVVSITTFRALLAFVLVLFRPGFASKLRPSSQSSSQRPSYR